jgi:porphobilinogen synthase
MIRTRRNRKNAAIRGLVREHLLHPNKLVYPLFLMENDDAKEEIKTLPNQFRLGLNHIVELIENATALGINTFMLFPVIEEKFKTPTAEYALNEDMFYYKAIARLKAKFPEVCFISDIALDPYSSDGHDGLVQNGEILNDETNEILSKMAVLQAKSGFDILGPSDMMDGRIGHMRNALDQAGFTNTSIMSYCAKYASAMYGPFRDALESAPKSGDKKTYQMDFLNRTEAMRELESDGLEGADFVMVKPALHYLDIISDFKQNSLLPVAAYHVSGEYAMLKMGADNGLFAYEKAMPETLNSIHRAGADIVITYAALDYALWYKRNYLTPN